jgi:F-type H+-transporting ATPase subunit epsilon
MALNVEVVTPTASAFSGEVEDIRIPGWLGEFDVLPGHDRLIALGRGGLLTLVDKGVERKFVVGRGFAEAGPERVTVLVDSCVAVEDTDLQSGAAELDQAEAALFQGEADSAEWLAAEEKAELARGKLKALGR